MIRLICPGVQTVDLNSFQKGLIVENRVLLGLLFSDYLRLLLVAKTFSLYRLSPDTTFFSSRIKKQRFAPWRYRVNLSRGTLAC